MEHICHRCGMCKHYSVVMIQPTAEELSEWPEGIDWSYAIKCMNRKSPHFNKEMRAGHNACDGFDMVNLI